MRRSLSDPYTIAGLIILIVAISVGQQPPDFFEQRDTGTSISQIFSEARWALDSQQKYKEVRVPFTQERGLIYVQALWAGKPVKCVLDTGATYISWPQTLGLAATPTGIPEHITGIGENRMYGKWFLVPSIELGGLKLKNVPTISDIVVKKASGLKTFIPQAKGSQKIILGNYVFENLVLTIDYQKQEVILRETDYDITRIPRLHSYLLDVLWDKEGSLVLLGQLAGHPARFQIDTGNTVGMVSNSAFAQKYLSAYPRTKSTAKTAFEVITSEIMPGVKANLGGIEFNTGILTIVPLNSNVDVLVGESFLKNFRVTIDYSRNKILLEPYSQPWRRLQEGNSH